MNKEIDWHGKRSPNWSLDNRDRTRFGAQTIGYVPDLWDFLRGRGAWPVEAACPAGWDERDALV